MGSSASCLASQAPYDPDAVLKKFPAINNTETLKKYITYVRQNNHLEKIKEKFRDENIIDENDTLTTGLKPFNVFARFASDAMPNPVDQSLLGDFADMFMVCHNLPENDLKWNDPDFYGASMAGPDDYGPGHVFITTRDLSFKRFNILPIVLENDAWFVSRLLLAAINYTANRGWTDVGFYFHCYPANSVQSLHLHVVNKETAGPTLKKQMHKNLDIYDVLDAMDAHHLF